MARYFKYNPQQYESMFVPLPLDLFAAKGQATQQGYDQLVTAKGQVEDEFRNVLALTPDITKRNELINQYKQNFNEAVDSANGNVEQLYSNLKNLHKDFQTDMAYGYLGAIQGNYQAYQDYATRVNKLWDEGKITEHARKVGLEYGLQDFTGTKDLGMGKYSNINLEDLAHKFDDAKFQTFMNSIESDSESFKHTEGYEMVAGSIGGISENKATASAYQLLEDDPLFQKNSNYRVRTEIRGMPDENFQEFFNQTIDDKGTTRKSLIDAQIAQMQKTYDKGGLDRNAEAVLVSNMQYLQSLKNNMDKGDYKEAYTKMREREYMQDYADAYITEKVHTKQSINTMVRSVAGDEALLRYEHNLNNPNTPILETNVSNVTPEILSAHVKNEIDKAMTGDVEAFSTLAGTVGNFFNKLVTSGASASTPDAILNRFNTIAKDNPDKNVADVFALMTRESLDMSKEEFAKAYNIEQGKLTDDMWAQTQEEAVSDWGKYNLEHSKKESYENAANYMASTLVDEDNRYLVKGMRDIDQKVRATEHDIWAANTRINNLQKAAKTRPLTNIELQQLENDKKFIPTAEKKVKGLKSQLQGYASEHPDEIITTFIEQKGNITEATQLLYGSELVSTGGGIKTINDTYEAQFKGKPVSELIANGALADYKDLLTDDEDAVVQSVTVMDAPLGMGNGYMAMVLKDSDGKMVTRVINLDDSSNAANIGLYGFAQNIQALEQPGVKSPLNSTIEQDLSRNYTWYGKTKFGNTLHPASNESDVQYVTNPSNDLVVMVKPIVASNGKITYELYSRDKKGNYTEGLPSKHDHNSYGDINAVWESLGQYDYSRDKNRNYVVPGTTRTPNGYSND
jgi:hypothetical protein